MKTETEIPLEEILKQITPLPWKAGKLVWKVSRHYSRDCIPHTAWKVKQGDFVIMGGMTKHAAELLAKNHNECLMLSRNASPETAYLTHFANVLPELIEAAMAAEKLLRQNLEASNAALKGVDPDSQFYGEDIVTPPILNRLKSALSRAEKVRVT